MERIEYGADECVSMRCTQCRRFCDASGGWLTIAGFLCQSCTDWLDGKKHLSHGELLALLYGELVYVRGKPYRVFPDRVERIH